MSATSRSTFLMPVFNDWDSARKVLCSLDEALRKSSRLGRAILVDDGSYSDESECFEGLEIPTLDVTVVSLRRNLGHQRAIAVGLAYLHEEHPDSNVVVMDSDGEDAPDDAIRLLDAVERNDSPPVVFAERTRRSEGIVFRAGYLCFRILHRSLTGHRIRFGNFSALKASALARLTAVGELWNHFAAGVVVSRVPYATIPTVRAKRLAGISHMGFVGLVLHGLRALSVFSEKIGVRLLVAAAISTGSVLVVGATILGLLGKSQLPVWALVAAIGTIIILLQGISLSGLFVLMTLRGRSTIGFVPLRDYRYFVLSVRHLVR